MAPKPEPLKGIPYCRLQKMKCFPGTTFKSQKQLKETLNKQPNKPWKKSQSKETMSTI